MLSFSRLYRPADQSVVQTSFSSLTLVFKLQLSLRCQQAMCVGFDLWKVTIFQYASTLVNQRLHFDVFLPTSSRVCKVSIFQLRYSPFFLLGLFWGLPRSHRLSSHSRLNAFVIQTKLKIIKTIIDLELETGGCTINPAWSYKQFIIYEDAIETNVVAGYLLLLHSGTLPCTDNAVHDPERQCPRPQRFKMQVLRWSFSGFLSAGRSPR
jgi:hypothetical protein